MSERGGRRRRARSAPRGADMARTVSVAHRRVRPRCARTRDARRDGRPHAARARAGARDDRAAATARDRARRPSLVRLGDGRPARVRREAFGCRAPADRGDLPARRCDPLGKSDPPDAPGAAAPGPLPEHRRGDAARERRRRSRHAALRGSAVCKPPGRHRASPDGGPSAVRREHARGPHLAGHHRSGSCVGGRQRQRKRRMDRRMDSRRSHRRRRRQGSRRSQADGAHAGRAPRTRGTRSRRSSERRRRDVLGSRRSGCAPEGSRRSRRPLRSDVVSRSVS